MLITCDNKGCLKTTEALLNVETKDVVCSECEQPIKNISESMKRVLKSSGQIVRETRKAFTMACLQCHANREVVLNSKNETVCSTCHSPIAVHAAMKLAMEETGTKLRKLTEEETAKAAKVPEVAKNVKRTKKTTKK